MAEWKAAGKRGVWFHVPNRANKAVAHLLQNGFGKYLSAKNDYSWPLEYHHAKKGKVVLLGWLPDDDTNNVPEYPYTGIGVGGLLINSNNQVLMVKEKYAFSEFFKLPGGHVDKGEDLHTAAIREVKEETGIDATFKVALFIALLIKSFSVIKGIVQFRHFHDMPIEGHFCSDIYFIVLLEPADESQTIRIQANEIQCAEVWSYSSH